MKKNDAMLNKARKIVADYYHEQFGYMGVTTDDMIIVWFSKTLQNWKALVTTTVPDGMYYEVTYNGDKRETYLDAYKKWENRRIPDEELGE